jgi:hypothetical protein
MLFPDIIWILLFMLSIDGLWWRAGDVWLRGRRFAPLWRGLWGAFMAGQIIYVLAALFLPSQIRSSRTVIPLAYHTQAYIWHLIVLPIILLALAGRWIFKRRRQRRLAKTPAPAIANPSGIFPRNPGHPAADTFADSTRSLGISRRQVLAAAAIAAPPLISATIAARAVSQLRAMRVRHFDLSLAKLPPALDGMTITQVTDLHIGRFLHADRLPQIVEMVNALESDFVVFTGRSAAGNRLPAKVKSPSRFCDLRGESRSGREPRRIRADPAQRRPAAPARKHPDASISRPKRAVSGPSVEQLRRRTISGDAVSSPAG